MKQEVVGGSGCGARRRGGLLLCNKTEQKTEICGLKESFSELQRGAEQGAGVGEHVCACVCVHVPIVQKPSGIQSPSDIMKIILLF